MTPLEAAVAEALFDVRETKQVAAAVRSWVGEGHVLAADGHRWRLAAVLTRRHFDDVEPHRVLFRLERADTEEAT